MASALQHRTRVLVHWLAIALGLVAIAVIVALFVVQTPWAEERARRLIVSRATAALDAELRIDKVSGSLLGDTVLDGVTVLRGGEPAIRADRIRVRFSPWRLWRAGLTFDEVELTRPQILLAAEEDGWNLTRLTRPRAPGATPGTPPSFGIRVLRLTDGALTIRPRSGPPRRLTALNLETSLDLRRGRLALGVWRGSLRDADTGLDVLTLQTDLTFDDRRLDLKQLAMTTPASVITGDITSDLDGGLAGLRFAVSGRPVQLSEFAPYLTVLERLPADTVVTFEANGPANDLRTTWTAVTAAGRVTSAGTTVRISGDATAAAGRFDAAGLDLSQWLDDPRWDSRIDAAGTFDLVTPRADARDTDVTFDVAAPAVRFMGYEASRVRAAGRYAGGRLDAETNGLAYGATFSARTRWTRVDGRLALDGRYENANLKTLPARLEVPPLETLLAGTFTLEGGTGGWQAATTIASGVVHGGTIAPGAIGTLDTRSAPIAYTFTGDVAGMDLRTIAPAVPAVQDLLTRLGGPITGAIVLDARGAARDTFAGHVALRLAESIVSGVAIRRATITTDVVDHALTADVTVDARGVTNRALDVDAAGEFEADGGGTARLRLADIRAPITFESISATGRLDLQRARVRGIGLDTVSVDGALDHGRLTLAKSSIAGPSVSASADGVLVLAGAGESDLRYTADLADLTVLEPFINRRVAGRATTTGRLTGPQDRLTAAGTVQATSLSSGTLRVLSLGGDYRVDVPDRDVARAIVQSTADATFVQVGDTRIDRVEGTARYDAGRLIVDARASQGPRAIDVAGEIVPHPDHREVHVRRASLAAGGATWRLEPGTEAVIQYGETHLGVRHMAFVSREGRLRIDGAIGGGATEPLRVVVENARLEDIEALWPSGRGVTGLVNGTALVSGALSAPVVSAELWVTGGAVDGVAFDRFGGTAAFADRKLGVELQLEAGPLGNLTAAGSLPLAFGGPKGEPSPHPYDLSIQSTSINLAFFQPMLPALDRLTGTGRLDVRVTGPSTAAGLAGSVALQDAAFLVRANGVAYQHLNAAFTIKDQRVSVERLSLEDDNGNPATVQGELTVPGIAAPRDFDLRITSNGFRVLDNQYGELAVSAELQAMGDLQTPLVSGTLSVDRGRIEASDLLDRWSARGYRPVAVEPAPAAAGATPAAPASVTPYDRSSLSITLAMPDNVVIRGRDLRSGSGPLGLGDVNVTVGGAMSIAKETDAPLTLQGRVEVVRGQYQFQGRRFDIQRGSEVRWAGPPSNPFVDVEGQRVISGITTSVVVRGTLDKPEITLSSNPPLDQGDILSLIVFNQAMNQLQSGERVSLAARAGVIAVGAIATPLADSVARALDLDLFEIRASDTVRGGAIVVGRQLSERLFVGFTQEFGAGEVSHVSFELRLNEFLRLVTSFAQGSSQTQFARRAEAAGIDLIIIVR